MDSVVVVGNCQAQALEIVLATNKAFSDRFEFTSFPPVHEISEAMVPALHDAVAKADVAVIQRIDEGYRNGVGLGTDTLANIADTATVVRWPSLYWAGYVPDLFYLRDGSGGPVVDGPFDYHDRVVLDSYRQGLDVMATCRLLEDAERPSDAEAWAANATAELAIRERDCDIQVASLIESGFREKLLFFTMNHPTNRLLGFVAQQIVDLIGVPGTIDHRHLPGEVLGSTFYPLHANHVRALSLVFYAGFGAGNAPFKIRGVEYRPEEAVSWFFRYYDDNPQLVSLNVGQARAIP